jgi:hypothetical protein
VSTVSEVLANSSRLIRGDIIVIAIAFQFRGRSRNCLPALRDCVRAVKKSHRFVPAVLSGTAPEFYDSRLVRFVFSCGDEATFTGQHLDWRAFLLDN